MTTSPLVPIGADFERARTWRTRRKTAATIAATLTALWAATATHAGDVCACLGDIDGNGSIGGADLAIFLGAWGPCGSCASCAADLTGDCMVDGLDLGIILGGWGPCPRVPNNDLCANASDIVNFTGSANPFCTIGASTDGPNTTCGAPSITGIDGDVWFRVTSPLTGTFQIGICADFDVRLAVYGQNVFGTCACPGGLFGGALLGCSGTESFDVCGQGTGMLVPVVAGECYKLRVGGATGQRGSGHIDINFYVPPCEISSNVKVAASGLEANTEFGIGVDISGDVGVAGAIFDDLFIGGANAGSARVYRYNGQVWNVEQSLFSPDAFPGQRFGVNVAASGDWIAVGAGDVDADCPPDPLCNTGIVYVYAYDGVSWLFDQSVTGDGSPEDDFGARVDIDGSRLIVSAREDDNANGDRGGAAYVFEHVALFGGVWLQSAKLLASDGDNFDEFGSDVAVSGTWAIVGADSDESGGSAYLFHDGGASWTQMQKLHPAGLAAGADFGYAVAIDGNIAIIGAPDFNGGNGKAYVYENYAALGWLLTATLTAHDGDADDAFGSAVSISGKQVLVGAAGETNGRGAAYLYWRVNGGWIERAKLIASDGADGDGFGGAGVAIHDGRGLIGSYLDNIGLLSDVGSVYRFHGLFECTGNGVAEACDIANGLADSDNDGIPDICEP